MPGPPRTILTYFLLPASSQVSVVSLHTFEYSSLTVVQARLQTSLALLVHAECTACLYLGTASVDYCVWYV